MGRDITMISGSTQDSNLRVVIETVNNNAQILIEILNRIAELEKKFGLQVESSVDIMDFPTSFDKFAKEYGFKDTEEVYTNGSDLIPVFRVKQWLEHDNKLRKVEIDTAYECGKHADKWISVKEKGYPRIEDEFEHFLVTDDKGKVSVQEFYISLDEEPQPYFSGVNNVVAWQPLPKPYKENEDKE